MSERYGLSRQGAINYANDAVGSLRGAKDRAEYVNNADAARLFGEAIDKTIAATGRLFATPKETPPGERT